MALVAEYKAQRPPVPDELAEQIVPVQDYLEMARVPWIREEAKEADDVIATIATWAAPYFVFSRLLRLPVVCGGLGHGGRQHVANEYMTVRGLADFEKFAATFLYLFADEAERIPSKRI